MKLDTIRSLLFLFSLASFLAFLGVLVPSSVSQDLPPWASIYVDPPIIVGDVGTNVTVSFNISNAHDIYAWQIRMEWNPTVLRFIDIAQGQFLNEFEEATTEEIPDENVKMRITTFKMNEHLASFLVYRLLYENKSTLLVGETLLGQCPGVSGDGTLCSAVFQVMRPANSVIQIDKESSLDTMVIMVIDSSLQRWPVLTQNGFFAGTNGSEEVTFTAGMNGSEDVTFTAGTASLGLFLILLPITLSVVRTSEIYAYINNLRIRGILRLIESKFSSSANIHNIDKYSIPFVSGSHSWGIGIWCGVCSPSARKSLLEQGMQSSMLSNLSCRK